jgi:hypothetical protein
MANLTPVSRHINTAPIYSEVQISAALRVEWMDEVSADMERNPPTIIVRHFNPNETVGEDYDLRHISGGFEVYTLRAGPAELGHIPPAPDPTAETPGELGQ